MNNTFYYQLLTYYKKHRRTPMSKRQAQQSLRQLVTDLQACEPQVQSLQTMTLKQLNQLLIRWRDNGYSQATIIRRLADVRMLIKASGAHLTIPLNNTLGLHEEKTRHAITKLIEPTQIQNKTIRTVCLMQYHFGLTKMEALQYHPYMHYAHHLLVPRKIAFNSVDRWLALSSQENEWLKTINKYFPEGFISRQATLRQLSTKHQASLAQHGIDVGDYFRLRYIAVRYKTLRQTKKQSETFKILREQLGYSRNEYIKRALACQDVF